VWLFVVVNYCYSFSGAASSVSAGVASSIFGGGGTQHGFLQLSPPLQQGFFLQHPFFAFLLQDALLLLQDFEALFLLQEELLLLQHPFFASLLQEDLLLLEQLFFAFPLQQVPFALFLQVASHIFPVLIHFISFVSVFCPSLLEFPNMFCAFTLAIPIKNTANNTIDNFFILNNF
jgi:hypothetical protein